MRLATIKSGRWSSGRLVRGAAIPTLLLASMALPVTPSVAQPPQPVMVVDDGGLDHLQHAETARSMEQVHIDHGLASLLPILRSSPDAAVSDTPWSPCSNNFYQAQCSDWASATTLTPITATIDGPCVVRFEVQWGDGTIDHVVSDGSQAKVAHTYPRLGTFRATAVATVLEPPGDFCHALA